MRNYPDLRAAFDAAGQKLALGSAA
jgi:hypothetical protein